MHSGVTRLAAHTTMSASAIRRAPRTVMRSAAPGPAPMNEIRPVTIVLLYRLVGEALPRWTNTAPRRFPALRTAATPLHPACPDVRRTPNDRAHRAQRSP